MHLSSMAVKRKKLAFLLLVIAFMYMLWSFCVVLEEEPASIQLHQQFPPNAKRVLHTSTAVDQSKSSAVTEKANPVFSPPASDNKLPDIFGRGLWQRQQVASFCRKHGLSHLNHTLPDISYSFRNEVFRHIIFDNGSRSLFCFMPKVGCTNMRSTLLLSHSLIPSFLTRLRKKKYLVEKKLERAMKNIAFTNEKLTDKERLRIIRTFKRFTILRHPLERLLSAYIDKIEGSLKKDGSPSSYNYFDRLKSAILNSTRQDSKEKISGNADVSFSVFIQWLVSQDYAALNEHFMPQYYNCEPCRMDYHFYGHFENFSEDANSILEQFKPGLRLAMSEGYHSNERATSSLLSSYYTELPDSLKKALYTNFSLEFDFYHHLFPQHRHLTTELLKIT